MSRMANATRGEAASVRGARVAFTWRGYFFGFYFTRAGRGAGMSS